MNYKEYENFYVRYEKDLNSIFDKMNQERLIIDGKYSDIVKRQQDVYSEISKLIKEKATIMDEIVKGNIVFEERMREITSLLNDLSDEAAKLFEERIQFDHEIIKLDDEYCRYISSLENNFDKEYENEVISISVGQLREKLSEYFDEETDIDISFNDDIYVDDDVNFEDYNFCYGVQFGLDSLDIKIKIGDNWFVKTFPVSLLDVQADDKTLIEHCYLEEDYNEKRKILKVGKDIDGISFNYNYKDLASNFSNGSLLINGFDINEIKDVFLNFVSNKKVYYKN